MGPSSAPVGGSSGSADVWPGAGAAASSGGPIPPPVPPPAPPPDDDGDDHEAGQVADAVVYLPHGKISFYSGDDRFEAVCRCHQVRRKGRPDIMCRLTRTSKRSERKKAQGRAVGLMAAWLGEAGRFDDKEAHSLRLHVNSIPRDVRRRAREFLKTLPSGPLLLSKEGGKLTADEDSEPELCP